MRTTERIERINNNLNKHFKSNNDAWWVSNSYTNHNIIILHRGIGGDKINIKWVAKFILKTEKSVSIVHYEIGCVAFTRQTLNLI